MLAPGSERVAVLRRCEAEVVRGTVGRRDYDPVADALRCHLCGAWCRHRAPARAPEDAARPRAARAFVQGQLQLPGFITPICPFLQGDVHEPAGPRCGQGRVQDQASAQPAHHCPARDGVDGDAVVRSCGVWTESVVTMHPQPARERPLRKHRHHHAQRTTARRHLPCRRWRFCRAAGFDGPACTVLA
jgi:hypothetical protein